MTKVLFVLSSVREGRNADNILELAKGRFETDEGFDFDVADFKSTPLPFINSTLPPSAEGFAPTDENVIAWTKQVADADVVVLLVSENNYSYSAVLKNAIDWIFAEWTGKPVALIGYGWGGGAKATAALRELLTGYLQAVPLETEANLAFTKDIDLSGEPIGDGAATSIDAVISAIKSNLNK